MELFTPDGEAMMAALDELDAAWDKLGLPCWCIRWGPGATLDVLNRLEIHRRRQPSRWRTTC